MSPLAETTDVRVWSIRINDGARGKTYTVRWRVSRQTFCKTYKVKQPALQRHAELRNAVRREVPFDIYTGLPISETCKAVVEATWYDHAVAFIDMKWPSLQPGSRRTIATAMATVTLALTSRERGGPDRELCFKALLNWSFNRTARAAGAPPSEYASAVAWTRTHSLQVSMLNNPQTLRAAYDATLIAADGKPYAVATHRNKIKALSGAIRYAIELGLLERNPLERLSTPRPRRTTAVDRRVVVNPSQARRLIAAVEDLGGTGPRYVAFFATVYFAGLRPSEALALRVQDCVLPERDWGELCFAESAPYVGAAWTDDGTNGPRKALKHRDASESRTVPAHPQLVAHLRNHIERFGTAEDGRLFVRANGGDIRYGSFAGIWSRARRAVLTDAQFETPLGKRPYDLRHACVSTWLNAGVAAPQVAEWAGHSVQMLLSTYAKCIDGQHERDRHRIALVLEETDDESAASTAPHAVSRHRNQRSHMAAAHQQRRAVRLR
ncbi:tyrosine-type recombinase/integrase [Catenulispora rubra]|uniref:tyrosine-type recombinase/integrase n=1 Tax=Catenulispora rubra TaxID=280293 RepID=UPI001892680B|nr:tyrosine-type recombinase/integrase [Catenulispora rubra]